MRSFCLSLRIKQMQSGSGEAARRLIIPNLAVNADMSISGSEKKLRVLRILCSVLAAISLFPLPAVAAPPRGEPMSVCDFVRQIKALDGRMVKVRGILHMVGTDLDEATPDYLSAKCPDLKKGIVEVRIEYPDVWFLKKPPKAFRVDKGSFVRARKVVMSTLKNGKVNDRYFATISGQVFPPPPRTAPPPGMHVPLEGSYDAGSAHWSSNRRGPPL